MFGNGNQIQGIVQPNKFKGNLNFENLTRMFTFGSSKLLYNTNTQNSNILKINNIKKNNTGLSRTVYPKFNLSLFGEVGNSLKTNTDFF
jgi:hypothetical protein